MGAPIPYTFTGTGLFKWFATMEDHFLANRFNEYFKIFCAYLYLDGEISEIEEWETFKEGMVYQFGSCAEVCEWYGYEIKEEKHVLEEKESQLEELIDIVKDEHEKMEEKQVLVDNSAKNDMGTKENLIEVGQDINETCLIQQDEELVLGTVPAQIQKGDPKLIEETEPNLQKQTLVDNPADQEIEETSRISEGAVKLVGDDELKPHLEEEQRMEPPVTDDYVLCTTSQQVLVSDSKSYLPAYKESAVVKVKVLESLPRYQYGIDMKKMSVAVLLLGTDYFKHQKATLIPKSWKFKFKRRFHQRRHKCVLSKKCVGVDGYEESTSMGNHLKDHKNERKKIYSYSVLPRSFWKDKHKGGFFSSDKTKNLRGLLGFVLGEKVLKKCVQDALIIEQGGVIIRMQHSEKKEKDWKFKFRDLDLSRYVQRDNYFLRENKLKGVRQEKKRKFKFLFCKVEFSSSEELIQPISLIAIDGNMKQNVRDEALVSFTKASEVIHIIRSVAMTDQAVLKKGLKAFASFARAYKEHHCSFIFRLKELEIEEVQRDDILIIVDEAHERTVPNDVLLEANLAIFVIDAASFKVKYVDEEVESYGFNNDVQRVSTEVELDEFEMMDEKAKSGLENKKGGSHKKAEEDSFSVRHMMTNEESKKEHQQEQKILRIESNEITWMQHQLQPNGYDDIVAERKYMEIMISYRYSSEEILRHRQAGSLVSIIQFEARATQFNRMCMQMQTLQDELVEIQRFKQRKVPKTWWYKYKNGVSQGPTIMDSLEKLLKVCKRIIVQICELGSYVFPTQEMLRLLPESWEFRFKQGVSKDVHNWSRNKSFICELLFKWSVLFYFGSLPSPPELKYTFMNLEDKVLFQRGDLMQEVIQGEKPSVDIRDFERLGVKKKVQHIF